MCNPYSSIKITMTFKELQQALLKVAEGYGKAHGIDIDQDFALLKLYEEVGEFAQAVLIHRKKSRPEKHTGEEASKQMMADELADIIGLAVMNANLFEIDLEEALERKWLKRSFSFDKYHPWRYERAMSEYETKLK